MPQKTLEEVTYLKRKIAKSLVLLLMLSTVLVFSPFSLAADATTTASVWVETPSTPAPTTAMPVVTAATTAVVPAGSSVHVVISGDTMFQIATKYKMTLSQLVAMNPQIKNVNMIYVGDKVMIGAAAPVVTGTPGVVKVYQGLGSKVAFRSGPGKDADGVPVYSFNIAMANATFDANGKILSVYIDGYEVATPNYDGASMPHFSGWPGVEGYNVSDHNDPAKVTGVSVNTPESAAAEVNAWATKRERGDSYHMNPANEWYKQMDFFQTFFVGKTVTELELWFAKNTTAAGRPIKASTTKADELAKLAALSEAEKAALADVVSGATMSIRDAHGDFLGAVVQAYLNRVEVTMPVN